MSATTGTYFSCIIYLLRQNKTDAFADDPSHRQDRAKHLKLKLAFRSNNDAQSDPNAICYHLPLDVFDPEHQRDDACPERDGRLEHLDEGYRQAHLPLVDQCNRK